MDLKVMPKSYRGDKYILCVIDEVTNYIITAPVKQAKLEEVGEILINSVFFQILHPRLYNYGLRQCIYVFDNDLFV